MIESPINWFESPDWAVKINVSLLNLIFFVANHTMHENEITIDAAGNHLSGTYCAPSAAGQYPVVLMIHGSGPLDRDENLPGQNLNVFNAIAHHLAGIGIASLRYDKRGCGASTGDYYRTGHYDLVDDALCWFDALYHCDSTMSQVFLLGHSEGTVIVPQVCLKRQSAAGLILLCPLIEKFEPLLIKQAMQLEREAVEMPGLTAKIRWLLSRFSSGPVATQKRLIKRLKSTTAETIKYRNEKQPAKWFREVFTVEPEALFQDIVQPTLIIGAGKDLHCDPGDVERIARIVKGPVESHIVENLSHFLRYDYNPPTFADYANQSNRPMEPVVAELIGVWLGRCLGRY